ncbi:WD repeat-containing protein 91 isoform X1 [Xenopus laevis]|uniref:WD repeat-containing protein 91 isoform X1 n=1 Tax=Xenopus laevis TaxID=8355 RepID=A0A8J1MDL6_XENLA|nr:WD repeat-containing protein 91 isoform X1 [Xenopus laevis]XP_041439807.1 WD repeat-containing protein 91 isoform X1 [Xenopus laevis]
MHCRVDCSGRRVASLDVDGVIKIWSIDGIMQTKASAISKSALLSLEWATKRDRLVNTIDAIISLYLKGLTWRHLYLLFSSVTETKPEQMKKEIL